MLVESTPDIRKRRIAFIPARGGSKGIENKNSRKLLGTPLVFWPIKAAIQSDQFDRVICSTDSIEIAKLARIAGAETLSPRPEFLSRDNTPTASVLLYLISELENLGELSDTDSFVLLEPTSPLTTHNDITRAIDEFENSMCTSLVSVSKLISGHPDFTFKMDFDTKILKHLQSGEWVHRRRQEISDFYFMDGSIYISQVGSFKKYRKFVQEKTYGFQLENWKSFEIDEELDMTIIEAIMKTKGYQGYDL